MSDVKTEYVSMNELMGITDPNLDDKTKREIAQRQQDIVAETEFKAPVPFKENSEKLDEEQAVVDDINFARNNIHKILEKSQEILDIAINEARTSPHPMNIKTAGDTMKMMKDIAESLVNIHNQKADIDLKKKGKNPKGIGMEPQTVNTTNNITQVVVEGTTNDLLDRARQKVLQGEIIEAEVIEHDTNNDKSSKS